MSSFRDTFTKDEQSQGQLNYDDAGFIFFGAAVLVTVLLPWTVSTIKHIVYPDSIVESNGMFPKKSAKGSSLSYCDTSLMRNKIESIKADHRKLSSRFSRSLIFKTVLIALLWGLVVRMGQTISQSHKEIARFDPFEILEISSSASDQEIKKAYRRMSLKYHPDRNPNDPLASANFIQVSKAYTALTDEVAKKNYEKYGNPDGPTTTKVGIGLPRFLLAGENQVLILSTFFLFLLVVVPLVFLRMYHRQKKYASSGVLVETLTFISYYMSEGTRAKNGPEMLAWAGESRQMPLTGMSEMNQVVQSVVEPVNPRFNKQGIVHRNRLLILAHMQRMHHLLSPVLRSTLDFLLTQSPLIIQSMVEIALMCEWVPCAISLIDFQRMLVQAINVGDSPLLQVPHFDKDCVRHATSGKGAYTSLREFLDASAPRKGTLEMTPEQLKDVEEFAKHVGKTNISARVEVEDESDIAEGDIASVVVDIDRASLSANQAEGPVHAPLFPGSKFEEFWAILVNTANGKMITYTRIKSQEKNVTERLRFMVGSAGDHHLQLHVVSDSYAGLDRLFDLKFKALDKEAVKKELFVHPEDAELDKFPTLFEQMMGIEKDDEYESDDEEGEQRSSPEVQVEDDDEDE